MKEKGLLKMSFVLALILCSTIKITAQTNKAYASLSTDKKTLTFYYDDQKSTRSGMGIGPFAYGSNRDWYLDVSSITTVKFDASFAGYSELTSTANWFDDCTNLSAIQGIENLNTTNVTDMQFMFSDCSSLTSLDLSSLKLSKVTSLRMMLQGCSSLTNLNIEGWDTSSVTDMFGMLMDCRSLTSVDLSALNTSYVTNMQDVFAGCDELTAIKLDGINTCNVTTMWGMFRGCPKLTSLDLSSFNTAKVTDMSNMFLSCEKLVTIYVSSNWLTTAVTESSGMFSGCYKLVGGKGTAYSSSNSTHTYAQIDGGTSSPGYLTLKVEDKNITFADSKVKELCVANWDTNGDGELSESEAAAVTTLGTVFSQKTDITSFNELAYFTGLTTIADRAFIGCSNLASVIIPDNVATIGNRAFALTGLTSLELKNGVSSLKEMAFFSTHLSSINVPASLTTIETDAFGWIQELSEIAVNSGNTVFDSRSDCNAIIESATNTLILGSSSTVIPNSVKSIGKSAFHYRKGLTSIALPEGLQSIGELAFAVCSNLKEINFPNSLTTIEDNAFYHSGLETVRITKNITSIGENPFTSEELTTISVDTNNAKYDSRDNCNAIIETSTNTLISGCKSTAIPAGIVKVAPWAFEYCTSLESITIPESVTSIGAGAFIQCNSLSTVTIQSKTTPEELRGGNLTDPFPTRANITLYVPFGYKSLYVAADYWKAFKQIIELEDPNIISFADSKVKELCVANWDTNGDGELSESEAAAVTTIGSVFKSKKDITSFDELVYFTGITTIGYSAFAYSSLTSVTIPKSVVSIMDDAFSMCTSLQDIVIPDNVVTIGKDAFTGCTAMKKFTIGSGLTSIGQLAFRWTELERFDVSASNTAFISVDGILFSKDIKELIYYPSKRAANSYTVPSTVTKIDNYAFFKCELGSINVPVSVTEIVSPPYAFYSESLKNIVVEDENSVYSSIDGVLFDKQKSTLICYPKGKEGAYTIPNGVTTIEQEAFNTADNLTEITFPEGFTTIKVGAFYYYSGKGFTTITLPASLTSIGDGAFHCDILETVHMKGATPPTITGSPFIPSPKAIYVPRIAVDTYKAAWPKLADIIFADPDGIPTGSFSISNVEDGVLTGNEAHLVVKLNNPSNYDQKGHFGFYYYYTEDMIIGYSWWPSENRNEVIVKPGENTYEFDRAVESALPAKFVAYFYPEEGERIELGSVVINSKIASGIQTITGDSQPFDVFDLRGNKVASKVKSLKGLPKGVYIVNGKKIIKK